MKRAWVVEISTAGSEYDPLTIYANRADARMSAANVRTKCRASKFRVVKYLRVER